MMRSLFAGVSGLQNHQQRMDVIGNNVANVNTTGYKTSRVTFQELFSQTLRGASSPEGGRGGTNPMQIGLGVGVSAIDSIMTTGSLQPTGNSTDMAIQGEGFFVIGDGSEILYTRDGAFSFDEEGYLTNANGLRVKGWMATDGVFPSPRPSSPSALDDIRVLQGASKPPKPTENLEFRNNIDASTGINESTAPLDLTVYDSQGNHHDLQITLTKTAPDTWEWSIQPTSPNLTLPLAADRTITFDDAGTNPAMGPGVSFDLAVPSGETLTVNLDFSGITQFDSDPTFELTGNDGYSAGVLNGITLDSTGVITGTYSNGLTLPLAQVALATFTNPTGLLKQGQSAYTVSNNSGDARIDQPGMGGRGTIAPQNLEMSNVDLAQEFTNMIITQRGFQANSRVITTSDEMLQELTNLKR